MSWPARSDLAEYLPGKPAVSAARTVEIVNARGLHARASAKFVKLASTFNAEVSVSRDGQTVDARSIMGLMMLAAGPGSTIEITAEGPEAQPAVDALVELVQARFDEDQ
jgi:phosphocarrier protein HPr